MKHTKRRIAIIGSSAAAVLLGSGIAVAYWTSTGSGSGAATVGTAANATVTQTSNNSGLYPGASSPLTFSVTNNDTKATLHLTSINVALDTTAVYPAGCSVADFSVTPGTITATDIAPGATVNVTSTGYAVNMTNNPTSNQDGCKTASVPLLFTAN